MKFYSIVAIICLITLLINSNRQQKILKLEIKGKEKIIDSLKSETFVLGTQLTRYEVSSECLKEKNADAAEAFEECLSQTE